MTYSCMTCSVRKLEDAAHLQMVDGGDFTPLVFDATDAEAVAKAAETVGKALNGHTLSALVNNAGNIHND